jgi:Rha family phage regulatory protein
MNLITTKNLKEINGVAYMSSRDIAELFEKAHKNVIRDIRNVIESLNKIGRSDLIHEIKDERGYTTEFLLNKNMTYIITLGFSGEKALRLKCDVIDVFVKHE